MIYLDYRTNNPRWGLSGIRYSSWENYAFGLGYLANIDHYSEKSYNGLIAVVKERNDVQGAWDKEGRIQYYGDMDYLALNLPDWEKCSSAGNSSLTCRINSNDYIDSLINVYGFVITAIPRRTTGYIYPPINEAYNRVLSIFIGEMQAQRMGNIRALENAFDAGWNL